MKLPVLININTIIEYNNNYYIEKNRKNLL
jgi:hypothetical protein